MRVYRRFRLRVEKIPAGDSPSGRTRYARIQNCSLADSFSVRAPRPHLPLLQGLTIVSMKQILPLPAPHDALSLPTLPRALRRHGPSARRATSHVGRIYLCSRILTDLVATTNDLRADLILLTGDLINYELSDLSDAMALVKSSDAGILTHYTHRGERPRPD